MRLNRNTRIGLLLIGAALILLLFVRMFQSLSAPPVVAVNNTASVAPAQPVALSPSGMAFQAKMPIADHTLITSSMLKPVQLPPSDSNSGNAALYVTDPAQVIGYVTAKPIALGQRIMTTDLLGHVTTVGVAGMLRPGFRAQIVPIPGKTTLHDLVAIGDYIDVIGSFDGQESRTIVQNVRVLAVDVFGGDFAPVKVARRGDYRADAPAAAAPAPAPAPAPGAPAAGPGATPTPTPTPEGPPVAKPDPAITVEVTPAQATSIALAQNATAALDFILRPRPAVATVGETRIVGMTKNRLAPYADRIKKAGGATTKATSTTRVVSNEGGRDRGPVFPIPTMQPPGPEGPVLQPAPIPAAPETYQIPIYGDGKIARYDTVRKP